ncbi:ricin-type beta-trefoil lectin domain protein [Planobispora siamensis]|uniref:Ricin B lectin domain-containing protein n=1 Tax=Planobispora siamensis TaxID=936338 RepID=A0A8J3SDN9_9ACTN|nr:ricin-type beta-trefoil lectin domain protein [Planobispora siamensis]GIH89964.1 hypothetical protein Psi01_05940 [Planobispora siamensis]
MTASPTPHRPRGFPRLRDDRGSMPMALLLTMVGLSLSALLVPVVLGQMDTTRSGSERVRTLHAAEAGVDTAVGQIRAAVDGEGNGLVEQLPPCELTGTLGSDSALGSPRYRVKITYQDVDRNDMGCSPTEVPAYAALVSTGIEKPGVAFTVGTAGTRTIEAIYSFKTTNANIFGGAIRIAQASGTGLCMDAGQNNESPPAGTRLRMQKCQPGTSEQQFAYTEDLSLKLVGSETSTAPMGMCLDAGATPQASGAYVVFQPCLNRTPRQQWSINSSSNFEGTSNGVGLNGRCFNMQSPGVASSYVVLGSCGGGNTQRAFRSDPGVGAGMANAATGQLVNFKQFSRCLDVTDLNVTSKYMIAWFCKQAPDGNVPWNQKWSFPAVPTSTVGTSVAAKATGRIRTVNGSGYCLRSPGSPAAGKYTTVTSCAATGTLAKDLQWTLYGDTGDYTTSYRIIDAYGYCLAPTDLETATTETVHSDGTSKVKVEVCSGSELQKWNAPANLVKPTPLTKVTER